MVYRSYWFSPHGFTGKLSQTFKEAIRLILYISHDKIFQKTRNRKELSQLKEHLQKKKPAVHIIYNGEKWLSAKIRN